MKIVVTADDRQWEELTGFCDNIEWVRVSEPSLFGDYKEAFAFFNLKNDAASYSYHEVKGPVFINAVTTTLKEVKATDQIVRINGWPGFLLRPVWEIAGKLDENIHLISIQLNKKFIPVADEPGLIAARVIAMIINEAYFALEDKVSTKDEIDTAMKLGTNYPYGPFEWAAIIGIKYIYGLLRQLSSTDKRFLPSALLMQEAHNYN